MYYQGKDRLAYRHYSLESKIQHQWWGQINCLCPLISQVAVKVFQAIKNLALLKLTILKSLKNQRQVMLCQKLL